MPNNIVNFKTAKKKAGYIKKEVQASENRKKHGRTKIEKTLDTFEAHKANKDHDAHKLEP